MSATVARTAFSDCPCCMPRRGFLAAAVMAGATSFAATAAEAQAPSGQAPAASPQPAAGGGGSGGGHRRLPRPLHDRAEGASRLAQAPDRCLEGPVADAVAGVLEDLRRPAPRERRGRAAQAPARARHERHDLLAAGRRHGPPHRHRRHQPRVVDPLQRHHPPPDAALPEELHRRLPAAAIAGRLAGELPRRARALRQGARLRRLQPQPGPVRRLLDRPAAHRPLLVSDLREDGRARRPGDDPCQRLGEPQLPRHRGALHQRRHHRLHAVHHRRPVPRLPDDPLHHPARRRRRALPLGPLPGPRAGPEAPSPARASAQRLLRHLRLPPGRHRPSDQGGAGREHPLRLGDGRRGARHRPRDRPPLRRHQTLHRRRPEPERGGPAEDLRGQRAAGVSAAWRESSGTERLRAFAGPQPPVARRRVSRNSPAPP